MIRSRRKKRRKRKKSRGSRKWAWYKGKKESVLWFSKKALRRPAEETACTSGNQPSVMAARDLSSRQLALISEKSSYKLEAERHEASNKIHRGQKERAAPLPSSS